MSIWPLYGLRLLSSGAWDGRSSFFPRILLPGSDWWAPQSVRLSSVIPYPAYLWMLMCPRGACHVTPGQGALAHTRRVGAMKALRRRYPPQRACLLRNNAFYMEDAPGGTRSAIEQGGPGTISRPSGFLHTEGNGFSLFCPCLLEHSADCLLSASGIRPIVVVALGCAFRPC